MTTATEECGFLAAICAYYLCAAVLLAGIGIFIGLRTARRMQEVGNERL